MIFLTYLGAMVGVVLHTIGCVIIEKNIAKGSQLVSVGFGIFAAVVISAIMFMSEVQG